MESQKRKATKTPRAMLYRMSCTTDQSIRFDTTYQVMVQNRPQIEAFLQGQEKSCYTSLSELTALIYGATGKQSMIVCENLSRFTPDLRTQIVSAAQEAHYDRATKIIALRQSEDGQIYASRPDGSIANRGEIVKLFKNTSDQCLATIEEVAQLRYSRNPVISASQFRQLNKLAQEAVTTKAKEMGLNTSFEYKGHARPRQQVKAAKLVLQR